MRKSQEGDRSDEARDEIRADGTWPARPVREEPAYVMVRWRLVSIQGSPRLVGYNCTNEEGRLSSRVVALDVLTREARTVSGRVYALEGASGFDADGDWVLACWLRRQGVPPEELHDLTPQLDAVLSRAAR